MPTYSATWPDVPQFDVTGEDLIDVLARTGTEYEAFTSDPDDDPDHVPPTLSWVVGWDGDRRVMRLRADGSATDVHVAEVTGPLPLHAPACCAVDGPCRNGCEADALDDVLAYDASVKA